MNAAIRDAIRAKRRSRFVYNGRTRVVEPQCHGIGTKGTELLRGHRSSGGTQRAPPLDVAKIERLVVLDETFDRPGPNDARADPAMDTIHAQL